MINGVTNAGSLPTLERLMQFAGARHRVIANNIANLSTPGFRPADVSVADFQASLRQAADERRATRGGRGDLSPADTDQVQFLRDRIDLSPTPSGEGVLFHDGNDRDVERMMQDMVENFMVFRQAAQLLRSRVGVLNAAIRERL